MEIYWICVIGNRIKFDWVFYGKNEDLWVKKLKRDGAGGGGGIGIVTASFVELLFSFNSSSFKQHESSN